ncbi:MAG: arginase family protein [Bacteriovorax sp.]|nr:arginase family protein [Bacteriovorax sp.]
MAKIINFSGISFEVGQSKLGLVQSSKNARKYFSILKEIGIDLFDHGDAITQVHQSPIKVYQETDLEKIEWDKYQQAYLKTIELLEEKTPLLNWGGDHSIALSTVGAFAYHYADGYVIWIDAHADLNLPSKSLTGNFHGMPLAILLNLEGIANEHFKWLRKTLNPKKLIYIGLRDIDPYELSIIDSLNIKTFFYKDILKNGIENIAKEISDITQGHPIHISFDIDSIDPIFAPSTGVPVDYGLTPDDLNILSEKLFKNSIIPSMDIVEINPSLGTNTQVEQTYLIAFNFLKSIFKNNYQGEFYDGMGKRDQGKHSSQMEWSL